MQALRDINPNLIFYQYPVAHYAAKKGIVKLFKVNGAFLALGIPTHRILSGVQLLELLAKIAGAEDSSELLVKRAEVSEIAIPMWR